MAFAAQKPRPKKMLNKFEHIVDICVVDHNSKTIIPSLSLCLNPKAMPSCQCTVALRFWRALRASVLYRNEVRKAQKFFGDTMSGIDRKANRDTRGESKHARKAK